MKKLRRQTGLTWFSSRLVSLPLSWLHAYLFADHLFESCLEKMFTKSLQIIILCYPLLAHPPTGFLLVSFNKKPTNLIIRLVDIFKRRKVIRIGNITLTKLASRKDVSPRRNETFNSRHRRPPLNVLMLQKVARSDVTQFLNVFHCFLNFVFFIKPT